MWHAPGTFKLKAGITKVPSRTQSGCVQSAAWRVRRGCKMQRCDYVTDADSVSLLSLKGAIGLS